MSHTVNVTVRRGEGLPVEMRGRRGFLLHDFQSTDVEPQYRPRTWEKCQSLPPSKWYGTAETEKMVVSNKEPLRESWQWFAFSFFEAYAAPTGFSLPTLKQKWADFMHGAKFITNGFGSETNADYINGTHLDKEPMKQETIATCGNMVMLTGEKRTISKTPSTGFLMLDRAYEPPDFNFLWNHPARDMFICRATVCRPESTAGANFPVHSVAPNGPHLVNPFPHFDGKGMGVPFVLSTFLGEPSEFMGLRVRQNWVRDTRVCLLEDWETPLPYVR